MNCNRLCGRPPHYAPTTSKLTFDLLILKVVSESRVTWATSVPILVFLGLSFLELGPMYATDVRQTHSVAASLRQTDVRQHHRLMPPPIRGGGITRSIWNWKPQTSVEAADPTSRSYVQ